MRVPFLPSSQAGSPPIGPPWPPTPREASFWPQPGKTLSTHHARGGVARTITAVIVEAQDDFADMTR